MQMFAKLVGRICNKFNCVHTFCILRSRPNPTPPSSPDPTPPSSPDPTPPSSPDAAVQPRPDAAVQSKISNTVD